MRRKTARKRTPATRTNVVSNHRAGKVLKGVSGFAGALLLLQKLSRSIDVVRRLSGATCDHQVQHHVPKLPASCRTRRCAASRTQATCVLPSTSLSSGSITYASRLHLLELSIERFLRSASRTQAAYISGHGIERLLRAPVTHATIRASHRAAHAHVRSSYCSLTARPSRVLGRV